MPMPQSAGWTKALLASPKSDFPTFPAFRVCDQVKFCNKTPNVCLSEFEKCEIKQCL